MSLPDGDYSFTQPPQTARFHGFLFDNDGTIIDSTPAVVQHWQRIGKEIGVDPDVILKTSHGRRSIDTFKEIDPSKANWEYCRYVEGLIPKLYGSSVVELPGSRKLISDLTAVKAPWTIVTSGTQMLVNGWLDILKLDRPSHLVSAEDVSNGKPDPECYAIARQKLGLESNDKAVVVLEDAPPGVEAGKAAGCKVIAVHTTYPIDQLIAAGADWIIRDLSYVKFKSFDEKTGMTEIEIQSSLELPN